MSWILLWSVSMWSQVERIVGGNPVFNLNYPFMVSVGFSTKNGYVHFCGGSLISNIHVLTAAHCTHGREEMFYGFGYARLGLTTQTQSSNTSETSKILTIHNHPMFHADTFDHDVSILEIQPTLFEPIELDLNDNIYYYHIPNRSVITLGWGANTMFAPNSNNLMEVYLHIDESCGSYNKQLITPNMFCAGAPDKDSCQGDSGGPLIVYESSKYKQIGVVSWRYDCANSFYPGVFSKLASMKNWIETIVHNVTESPLADISSDDLLKEIKRRDLTMVFSSSTIKHRYNPCCKLGNCNVSIPTTDIKHFVN
jgi:secreted trypsin-like serine protease